MVWATPPGQRHFCLTKKAPGGGGLWGPDQAAAGLDAGAPRDRGLHPIPSRDTSSHHSHKPTAALPLERRLAMSPSPVALPQLSSPDPSPKQGPEEEAEAGQWRPGNADGTSGHLRLSSSRYLLKLP